MDLIRAVWKGDLPLWKAYWLFGGLGGLCWVVALQYIEFTSLRFFRLPGSHTVYYSIVAGALAYFAWVSIGIWRSADRYEGLKRYAVLARLVCLIGWARVLDVAMIAFVEVLHD